MLKYNLRMENGWFKFQIYRKNHVFLYLRHAGIIIQCQPRKYLVQVEQQQYWIESDLIRPNTIIDQVGKFSYLLKFDLLFRNEMYHLNTVPVNFFVMKRNPQIK